MSELSTGFDSKRDSKGFIKPYYIEELGDLGLTSIDIAECLSSQHAHVLQKLRRICLKQHEQWESLNWRIHAYAIELPNHRGKPGRKPSRCYALNVRASKAFLAKWDNDLGRSYLNFLFTCEEAAPKLIEEIASLRQERARLQIQIETLQKPRRKYLPGQGTVAYLVEARMTRDMFGTEYCEKIRKAIPVDKLTDVELREWRIQHRAAVIEGLAKNQKQEIDETAVNQLPPDRRGQLIPFQQKGDL